MNTPEPRGYCIADIRITRPEAYPLYMERSTPAVAQAGGRFLIRGGSPEVLEGERETSRIALVEFDSVPRALDFSRGAAYQEAIALRQAAAECDYAVLTGADPAQIDPAAPAVGPKGYIYAVMQPTDLDKYMEYPKMSTPIVRRFGGRFIIRGGQPHRMEGDWPTGRVVLAEFPLPRQARDFYFSPEYQQALKYRQRYARSSLCLLTGV